MAAPSTGCGARHRQSAAVRGEAAGLAGRADRQAAQPRRACGGRTRSGTDRARRGVSEPEEADRRRTSAGATARRLPNSRIFAAQLEEFQEAIDLYRVALKVAKALAPLQAVEQLANMLGREAPRLAVTKGTGAAQRPSTLFVEAIDWLDWLDEKLAAHPRTARAARIRPQAVGDADRVRRSACKHLAQGAAGLRRCAPATAREDSRISPELAGAELPAQEAAASAIGGAGADRTGPGRGRRTTAQASDRSGIVSPYPTRGCTSRSSRARSLSQRSSTKSTMRTGTRWRPVHRRASAPRFATTWCSWPRCCRIRR